MTKLIPTEEQDKVKDVVLRGNSVVVQAFSGASKTTTCVMVAEAVPKSALYLTFNKAMQEEAKDRMPPYVECRTWHSLAFANKGTAIMHKLKRPYGRYQNVCGTGTEIAKYFKLKNLVFGEHYVSANAVGLGVKETLARFEYSDSKEITEKHLSVSVLSRFKVRGNNSDYIGNIYEQYKSVVLLTAKKLWNLRIDETNNIMAYHDTYLKLYQLSKPDLSEYDIVFSDESQDSSMVMIDILKNTKCQLVVVGDGYQQIYKWRGSVNAMKRFDGEELKLTKSFRFGNKLAKLASAIIGEGIVGNENIDTSVVRNSDFEIKGSTILFRTNANLLREACKLIREDFKVNLEIDTKDFLKLLESAVALLEGRYKDVKHEYIVPYNNWDELENDVNRGLAAEVTSVFNLVNSGEWRSVISTLKSHKNTSNPDVVLTTAHKSKGREFDTVVLYNDFPTGYNQKGEWEGLSQEETNLLYVACTRAINKLHYNTTVENLLYRNNVTID